MEGREAEIEAYLKLRVQGVDRVSIGDHDRARGAVYLIGGATNRRIRELLAAYPAEPLTALPSQHRSLVPFMAGVPGPPAIDTAPDAIKEQARLIVKELQLAGITDCTIRGSVAGELWAVEFGPGVSELDAVGAIARTPRVRDVRAHSSRRWVEFVVDVADDRATESCGRLS